MADKKYTQNILSLAYIGWLYLVQGIPYGLQDKFIPLQLRSKGLSYSSVSLLKALFVPWVTKGLWAPVVEVWGGRHRWLFVSLLALGITAYVGSHIALENVVGIGCMLLSLNTFSAVQDVAVDGIALQLLPDEQLGLGNTIQVVLYKVGWLVGGAGFIYMVAVLDWSMTFVLLALVYMLTAILVTVVHAIDEDSPENQTNVLNTAEDNNIQHVDHVKSPNQVSHIGEVVAILKDVFHTPGIMWLSTYVLLYKMGERGAVNNMPLYLLDRGMSKKQLAFWNGVVSQGLSILGSFYGGILLSNKQKSVKGLLLKHSLLRFLFILVQFILIVLWDQNIFVEKDDIFIFYTIGIISICSLSYSSGLISTASFTLMMQVSRACDKKTQASHYSAMASVEVGGKLLFAILAGFIIDHVGMAPSFALFTLLSFLPLFILRTIPVNFDHLKTE